LTSVFGVKNLLSDLGSKGIASEYDATVGLRREII
jgi:hypothetical protein